MTRKERGAENTVAFGPVAERYRRAGDAELAVAICREGLARMPDHLSGRVTLGWALLDLGQYGEARAELQQVLRRAPDNLAAIRGLAELHDREQLADVMPADTFAWQSSESSAVPEPTAQTSAAVDSPPAAEATDRAPEEPPAAVADLEVTSRAEQTAVADAPVEAALTTEAEAAVAATDGPTPDPIDEPTAAATEWQPTVDLVGNAEIANAGEAVAADPVPGLLHSDRSALASSGMVRDETSAAPVAPVELFSPAQAAMANAVVDEPSPEMLSGEAQATPEGLSQSESSPVAAEDESLNELLASLRGFSPEPSAAEAPTASSEHGLEEEGPVAPPDQGAADHLSSLLVETDESAEEPAPLVLDDAEDVEAVLAEASKPVDAMVEAPEAEVAEAADQEDPGGFIDLDFDATGDLDAVAAALEADQPAEAADAVDRADDVVSSDAALSTGTGGDEAVPADDLHAYDVEAAAGWQAPEIEQTASADSMSPFLAEELADQDADSEPAADALLHTPELSDEPALVAPVDVAAEDESFESAATIDPVDGEAGNVLGEQTEPAEALESVESERDKAVVAEAAEPTQLFVEPVAEVAEEPAPETGLPVAAVEETAEAWHVLEEQAEPETAEALESAAPESPEPLVAEAAEVVEVEDAVEPLASEEATEEEEEIGAHLETSEVAEPDEPTQLFVEPVAEVAEEPAPETVLPVAAVEETPETWQVLEEQAEPETAEALESAAPESPEPMVAEPDEPTQPLVEPAAEVAEEPAPETVLPVAAVEDTAEAVAFEAPGLPVLPDLPMLEAMPQAPAASVWQPGPPRAATPDRAASAPVRTVALWPPRLGDVANHPPAVESAPEATTRQEVPGTAAPRQTVREQRIVNLERFLRKVDARKRRSRAQSVA